MSVATRWDTRDYGRIVSAEWRDGAVVVRFGDRSWVNVAADQLLPPGTKGADWDRLTFSQYEIVVPTTDGQIEIPWSSIRALTDREYGSHLAEAAGDEARQIGLRIKEL